MMNRTVFYKLGMVAAFAVAFQACKPKVDITDNNELISKPYSLYIGLQDGRIWNTNDGYAYKAVKGADGAAIRGMAVSGNNLLYLQNGMHVIEFDKGESSNPILTTGLNPNAHFATMFLNWPKVKRIYYAGGGGTMAYNDSNGKHGHPWIPENAYPQPPSPEAFPLNFTVTSFTMLHKNRAFAYDDQTKRLFWTEDPVGNLWREIGGVGGLLTAGRKYFLSHIDNTVLLVADSGYVYFSTNDGVNWDKWNVPATAHILSACTGNNQSILVGTDGQGVWRLPLGQTTFVPSSNGLPANAIVNAMIDKYDLTKNDKKIGVVFAGTPSGLYKSFDRGENWSQVSLADWNVTSLH